MSRLVRNTTTILIACMLLMAVQRAYGGSGQRECPVIPEHGRKESDFAPAGWRIYKSASGDLNKDGRPDVAFVVVRNEDNIEALPQQQSACPRVVVVALREADGSLHRECVAPDAIMTGDLARNFALNIVDISIDNGNVDITNANGATQAASFLAKYRLQKGVFELIGMTRTYANVRENYSDRIDKNLNTGFTIRESSGPGNERERSLTKRYYSIRSGGVRNAPTIDGVVREDEWPGRTVWLDAKEFVVSGRAFWNKPEDLTAIMGSVHTSDRLFLHVVLIGTLAVSPVSVELVNEKGQVIRAIDSAQSKSKGGITIESVYSMASLARATIEESECSPAVSVSAEVTVNNEKSKNGKVVLSTSGGGRKYPAEITLNRTPELPLLSEFTWEHPDD